VTIRERHLRYYLVLAEVVHGARHGPEQVMRLAQLEAEHDNLRAALGWAREADNPEGGLRLTVALRIIWEARGHVSEGRRWLEELLALAGSGAPDLRATALNTAGWLAETQRDFRRACELLERSLGLARELGDQRIMADALNRMGWIMIGQGDLDRAADWLEQGLALARTLEDTALIRSSLCALAEVRVAQGRAPDAQPLAEESVELG
jgi:predicted ATPase